MCLPPHHPLQKTGKKKTQATLYCSLHTFQGHPPGLIGPFGWHTFAMCSTVYWKLPKSAEDTYNPKLQMSCWADLMRMFYRLQIINSPRNCIVEIHCAELSLCLEFAVHFKKELPTDNRTGCSVKCWIITVGWQVKFMVPTIDKHVLQRWPRIRIVPLLPRLFQWCWNSIGKLESSTPLHRHYKARVCIDESSVVRLCHLLVWLSMIYKSTLHPAGSWLLKKSSWLKI